MKTKAYSFISVGMLAIALFGRTTSNRGIAWQTGTTTINASGKPGSSFTAFYIKNGQRLTITNSLPLVETGLSEFQIRKANPQETLALTAKYDGVGNHTEIASSAAPGVPGLRVQIKNGLEVQALGR